jgi:methionine synthase I (cobalamin-dependent)
MNTESTPTAFALLDWLQERAPVFSEGSLMPILQKFGLPENQPPCLANLEQMDWVRAAYKSYQRAGADFFRTNTAGANVLELTQQGMEGREEAINNNGMALLREALGKVVSAGLLRQAESQAELGEHLAERVYGHPIVYLSDTGADLLWAEGFTRLEELQQVARLARRSFQRDCVLHLRLEPDIRLGERLQGLLEVVQLGRTVVGLHASALQPGLVEDVEQLVGECGVISVVLDELPQIEQSPSPWFQRKAEQLLEQEVALFGLGVNTTPEHLRWLRDLRDGVS